MQRAAVVCGGGRGEGERPARARPGTAGAWGGCTGALEPGGRPTAGVGVRSGVRGGWGRGSGRLRRAGGLRGRSYRT